MGKKFTAASLALNLVGFAQSAFLTAKDFNARTGKQSTETGGTRRIAKYTNNAKARNRWDPAFDENALRTGKPSSSRKRFVLLY
jgi:hypothetical protein